MSYSCRLVGPYGQGPEKWKVPQERRQLRVRRRRAADRGRSAAPRRVRFAHEVVWPREFGMKLQQRSFVRHHQNDGVRVEGKVSRSGLARGVNQLGGQESERKIGSDDAVVTEGGALTVNAT